MEKKHSLKYKELLEKSIPVVMDSIDYEMVNDDEQEVERLWLEDIVDGKWVEDYVTVKRTAYDIVTDEDGAVFALIDNGRMLVKAPNMRYYRIPEDVYRIADYALRDCSDLEELDVPYNVSDYEIGKAIKHSCHLFKVHLRDGYLAYCRGTRIPLLTFASFR